MTRKFTNTVYKYSLRVTRKSSFGSSRIAHAPLRDARRDSSHYNIQVYVLIIRAVAGQRSSPDLCFVTKSIKSTTKDIDLIVTQVGCDGTA